jgi:hypothetical protein
MQCTNRQHPVDTENNGGYLYCDTCEYYVRPYDNIYAGNYVSVNEKAAREAAEIAKETAEKKEIYDKAVLALELLESDARSMNTPGEHLEIETRYSQLHHDFTRAIGYEDASDLAQMCEERACAISEITARPVRRKQATRNGFAVVVLTLLAVAYLFVLWGTDVIRLPNAIINSRDAADIFEWYSYLGYWHEDLAYIGVGLLSYLPLGLFVVVISLLIGISGWSRDGVTKYSVIIIIVLVLATGVTMAAWRGFGIFDTIIHSIGYLIASVLAVLVGGILTFWHSLGRSIPATIASLIALIAGVVFYIWSSSTFMPAFDGIVLL